MKSSKPLFSKVTQTTALAMVLAITPSVISAPVVGPNGHYYDVIGSGPIPWDDANANANGMEYLGLLGHLVTISDATEDAFVNSLVSSLQFGEVWAGGYQDPLSETDPEAGWTWVNDEGEFPGNNSGPTYAAWSSLSGTATHPGQPDDFYGSASEQYLGLNLWGPQAGWNDEMVIDNIGGYVVEYEASSVPDGGLTITMLGMAMVGLTWIRRKL
jgi:hypothetical protein